MPEQTRPSRHRMTRSPHVIVVGASLSGLMTGLALARLNTPVTLIERSHPTRRSGAALPLTPPQLADVLGAETVDTVFESIGAHADRNSSFLPVTWESLHEGLLSAARADPRIELRHKTRISRVEQHDTGVQVSTDDGRVITGDVLIGADGHRSIVRALVDPRHPDAQFRRVRVVARGRRRRRH